MTLKPAHLVIAVAVFFVAALNGAFWTRLIGAVGPATISDWAFIAAIAVVLTALLTAILALLSFKPVLRVVLALLLPVSAAAAYFMTEYGVVIDLNMVRNTFETNTAEAADLVSTRFVLSVLAFGVVPALLVWFAPVAWRSPRESVVGNTKLAVAAAAIAIVVGFPFAGDFLSVFRENKVLRLSLTPSNYISATLRYLRKSRSTRPTIVETVGGDARRNVSPSQAGRKRLLVIAVGETARAANFSLNGYARPTTPKLQAVPDLINFPLAYSCGTDTAHSVPCMFSNLGRAKFSVDAAAARENLLDILKRAGLDVQWRENQAGCKGVCARIDTEVMTTRTDEAFRSHGETHDEILLSGLKDSFKAMTRDKVLVLHMMGSHGPAYWKRYPEAFERFTPVCRKSQFSHCTPDEIVNAYDNTITYTDHVLATLIETLRAGAADGVETAMIYMSDHGESLGENNLYLHGMPYAIAPEVQIHVPMVMWLAPQTMANAGLDGACLIDAAKARVSHDNLFHSVLGLMDIATDA
ncbi:MAG: phosphoethanolamine transferase [Hyphomicrobium sp.]